MIGKCYICNTPAGRYHYNVDSVYSIIKCTQCGLEYTHPVPSNITLESFYSNYLDVRANPEIVRLNAEANLKILATYGWSHQSKLLDFGAGKGIFVETAGKNAFGMDLQPSLNPRIHNALDTFKCKQWDFITLYGVLEHLSSPLQIMTTLASLLRQGGIMAITTVNAEGIIPYYYKPPEHLTYWTRSSFEIMSKYCNMKIIKYSPYEMYQLGSVYFERLLSRTPELYRQCIYNNLPRIVSVPTNEIMCILRK
ncbi:MAG: class I SAM-dependent methyltransferase [Pseudomonadota bacterium]